MPWRNEDTGVSNHAAEMPLERLQKAEVQTHTPHNTILEDDDGTYGVALQDHETPSSTVLGIPYPRANEPVAIPPRRMGGSFVGALINGRSSFRIHMHGHYVNLKEI